jgi:ribosomal protein RSM22 (predicted rRNA methylase)
MNNKLYDDFDWQNVYPYAHYNQTVELEKDHQFDLPKEHTIIDGKLIYSGKPLVKNAEWLYEKVYELRPSSIFEVGFGYCNHLLSINRMMPEIKLSGCDISYYQFSNGYRKYGEELKILQEKSKLFIGDFTEISIDEKYDLVYSQAVVMHMSTEKAMRAITKMCSISKKYVICLDGGLIIPNIRNWLETLGKVTYFDDWADQYWTHNNISPFIIEV